MSKKKGLLGPGLGIAAGAGLGFLAGGPIGALAGGALGGAVGAGASGSLMPGQQNIKMPNFPPPEEPPLPDLPQQEAELTAAEITQRRGEVKGAQGLMAPSYLGLQQEMSPLQKRTKIATGATSGDVGTDPEALKQYRNLAFGSINDAADILPVERQYLSLFGESARSEGTGGYFSALERIYKRFM